MRDLEKQLGEMARMDRSFQASLDMIKRIEAGANIGTGTQIPLPGRRRAWLTAQAGEMKILVLGKRLNNPMLARVTGVAP